MNILKNIAYKNLQLNKRKNIFNRFYRGENSSSNSAGIGLSLAKKIILMDNGKISVESKKNKYTIFKIKYFNLCTE